MSQIFFTADTHFGHKNIIKYSNRPFASAQEMDEQLIERWNQKVAADDSVYHLGDVGLSPPPKLREVLDQLNGKIYLIRGNHEKSADACRKRFEWIKDYFELEVEDPDAYQGKRYLTLFHYAMRVWNASHHGTWSLYGHTHGELEDLPDSLSLDVGVDCHDFAPLSYQEVKNLMANKKWESPLAKR